MTSVLSTVLTVTGTPTEFLPLATPWPSGNACAANIYLHTPVSNPNTFLAFDPLFGASMAVSAQSCLPPQVTSWWGQGTSPSTYIALGPTFVCPEAYTAVQTALIASSIQQIFCCPSQYSFLVPQPNRGGIFPSQCLSTISIGQTFSYLSNQAEANAFTATVVMTSTASVFAIPVNGFNFANTASIIPSSISSMPTISTSLVNSEIAVVPSSTANSSSTQQSSHEASSTSLSDGSIAGISIAAVIVAIFMGVVACFVRKRRNQAKMVSANVAEYEHGGLPVNMKPELEGSQSTVSLNPVLSRHLPPTEPSKIHYIYELANT